MPYNEKAITKVLKAADGPVGVAARADNKWVTVTAGAHQGGRPGDREADMRWHITVRVPDRGTFHVALAGPAGKPRITGISQGPPP